MIGERFGRLVVHARADNFVSRSGKAYPAFQCVCDCGERAVVLGQALRSGNTKSCGCYARDVLSTRKTQINRATYPGEYNSWAQMRSRCHDPKANGYKNYGGRGVSVCDRWASFEQFVADMGPRPAGHSIERKDSSGDYEPGNCCWASRREQSRNTRRTVRVTIDGETLPLVDWAARFGISYGCVRSRIRRGMVAEVALRKPTA